MPSADKRADRLAQVRSQVDYHRQRLVHYQRMHGSQPCIRLAELEDAYHSARDRLAGLAAPQETPERDSRGRSGLG
jgi:hypothetical protein